MHNQNMQTFGIHIVVKGLVQGVGYRYYIQNKAQQCDITGTVENIYNRSVEIYAYGTKENLKKFGEYCQKGPPYAYVKNITQKNIPHHNVFSFRIL